MKNKLQTDSTESIMKSADKPKHQELDAYMSGYCQRCFRLRTECQKVIDSGKRCTEKS